ncbi:MAG: zf-HC2 domain-containing protein [Ignavibacteriales bacterium]|nr:zf-HC2 domain-containing protein [Ignavibacteriales bacterium]
MNCKIARDWLLRELDGELSVHEEQELHAHLAGCAACVQESRLVKLPGRIARSMPAPKPSPYFYSRLKAFIESEKQPLNMWQIILGLSHRVVPSCAVVMLVFLAAFTYYHFKDVQAGSLPDLTNESISPVPPEWLSMAVRSPRKAFFWRCLAAILLHQASQNRVI